jgi:hypothetical protein
MKVLDVRWFNGAGIVKVEDEFDGIKYYIRHIDGYDEKKDIQMIAEWGSTFPKDAGDVLFS